MTLLLEQVGLGERPIPGGQDGTEDIVLRLELPLWVDLVLREPLTVAPLPAAQRKLTLVLEVRERLMAEMEETGRLVGSEAFRLLGPAVEADRATG